MPHAVLRSTHETPSQRPLNKIDSCVQDCALRLHQAAFRSNLQFAAGLHGSFMHCVLQHVAQVWQRCFLTPVAAVVVAAAAVVVVVLVVIV